MERCDKFIPSHTKVGTQCVLSKGHQETDKPEYAKCCADTSTLIHRINKGRYLDVTARP